MTIVIIVCLGVLVLLVLAALFVPLLLWRQAFPEHVPDPTWLEALTLHRVIAHTTDDQSIEGLLDHVGDDGITLRAAKLLGPHPMEMAGETWIPRSKVRFVQTVPTPAP